MIDTPVSATSASVALTLIRPAAAARSVPAPVSTAPVSTALVPAALVPAVARVESRQDRVTLSAEAKRLGGLTEGRSVSLDAGGAGSGSSEAAYGRAVQQRVRAMLAGRNDAQAAAPSTEPGSGETVPTATAPSPVSTSPEAPTSPTPSTTPVAPLVSREAPTLPTSPTPPTVPVEPPVSPEAPTPPTAAPATTTSTATTTSGGTTSLAAATNYIFQKTTVGRVFTLFA